MLNNRISTLLPLLLMTNYKSPLYNMRDTLNSLIEQYESTISTDKLSAMINLLMNSTNSPSLGIMKNMLDNMGNLQGAMSMFNGLQNLNFDSNSHDMKTENPITSYITNELLNEQQQNVLNKMLKWAKK